MVRRLAEDVCLRSADLLIRSYMLAGFESCVCYPAMASHAERIHFTESATLSVCLAGTRSPFRAERNPQCVDSIFVASSLVRIAKRCGLMECGSERGPHSERPFDILFGLFSPRSPYKLMQSLAAVLHSPCRPIQIGTMCVDPEYRFLFCT